MKSILLLLLSLPVCSWGQTMSGKVDQMHTVLENLYQEMMPLCAQIVSVAQIMAGFGALLYIGYRVWKHIANAEPIDFFPLLRPFALSLAIGLFPQLLGVINGILQPVTLVTASMVKNTHADVDALLHQRELAAQGKGPVPLITDPAGQTAWNQYDTTDQSGGFWSNLLTLNFTQLFTMFIATVLEVLYYAASLCIDCLRTFHMVILAILGPLVFAIAVYDGFQHTLSIWFARYINVYLWLPIANLFGALIAKVQSGMLHADIVQLQQGDHSVFSQTDLGYLVFMIVGIVGYVSIPSIANYVVHASSGSAIMSKVNNLVSSQLRVSGFINRSAGGSGGSMSGNVPGDDRKVSSMADAANSDSFQSGKIAGH